MGFREELQKRAEKKRAEIDSLRTQLQQATSYLQALEDTLKLLPKDQPVGAVAVASLRAGSRVAQAREVILQAGHPLHIEDLLNGLGLPNTKLDRAGLSGSLSAYVRKQEIFTRPAPNTFGLIELATNGTELRRNGPPPNFGIDDGGGEDEELPLREELPQ